LINEDNRKNRGILVMATPLMINIAIWYVARPADYGKGNGDNNFHAAGVQEILKDFVDGGLLEKSKRTDIDQEYLATDAMRLWVSALCRVPWPIQKWVIPIEHMKDWMGKLNDMSELERAN
jgi:hypothetical protein